VAVTDRNHIVKGLKHISILSVDGRSVVTCEVSSGPVTIDVSSLKPGVYLVRIQGESGVLMGKMVKE
jgi:hypothetical protein